MSYLQSLERAEMAPEESFESSSSQAKRVSFLYIKVVSQNTIFRALPPFVFVPYKMAENIGSGLLYEVYCIVAIL